MKKIFGIVGAVLCCAGQPVMADLLGLPNVKSSRNSSVFLDIGQVDIDDTNADGPVFGVGIFYQLRGVQLLQNTESALKFSFHTGTISAGAIDLDVDEIAIDYIISGDQLSTTNLGWYGNIGIHRLGNEVEFGGFSASDDETEFLFGGGVLGSLSFGEWYAGIDFIDGALLQGGIRYNF